MKSKDQGWFRIYEIDDFEECHICEEWWCPRCKLHGADCPCITIQMASDLMYEISDCGRYARNGR